METDVFWEMPRENWSTASRVKLSYDRLSGDTKLTMIEAERENSISTFLTPSDSLEMAVALIAAAQKQFEEREERFFEEEE